MLWRTGRKRSILSSVRRYPWAVGITLLVVLHCLILTTGRLYLPPTDSGPEEQYPPPYPQPRGDVDLNGYRTPHKDTNAFGTPSVSQGRVGVKAKSLEATVYSQQHPSDTLIQKPPLHVRSHVIASDTQRHINAKRHIKSLDQTRNATRDSAQNTSGCRKEPEVVSRQAPETSSYLFNCSNIHHIKIKHKLGHGISKQVYLGYTGNGARVAVKMVTRNAPDVVSCLRSLRPDMASSSAARSSCYGFPNMKLMKEILLLQQLRHPNLLDLQGYCVRSEETVSTSLEEHGVVAVYGYGQRFYLSSLSTWSLPRRLTAATQLADLLDYLEHSPLGSLRISDFKEEHFLLEKNRIKLVDLDDITSLEPECNTSPKPRPGDVDRIAAQSNSSRPIQPERTLDGNMIDLQLKSDFRAARPHISESQPKRCGYRLDCIGGLCLGSNAKQNLENMNRLLFKHLLFPDESPGDNMSRSNHLSAETGRKLSEALTKLRQDLVNLSINAGTVRHILQRLLKHTEVEEYGAS